MENLSNPCPPMRGRHMKVNGKMQEVVNAFRNAQTGDLHYKIGRKWYVFKRIDNGSSDKR